MRNKTISSWVPDYAHHENTVDCNALVEFLLGRQIFNAARGTSFTDHIHLPASGESTLKLKAVVLDTVENSTPRVAITDEALTFAIIRQWEYLALLGDTYPNGEARLRAFWRTILEDKIFPFCDAEFLFERRRSDHVRSFVYCELF